MTDPTDNEAEAFVDRALANSRAPDSTDATARALGTLTMLLDDMYQRHGIPQWHRGLIDRNRRRTGETS